MPKRNDEPLKHFADRYRLKLRRDKCGDFFVGGKLGQVYEYNPKRLAILFLGNTIRQWNAAQKKMAAAGFELMQDADEEGTASFGLADDEQCRVAIQVIRAKRRRVLTSAQRAQLRTATEKAALVRIRKKHRARGVSRADFGPLDTRTTPRSSKEN